MTTKPDDDDTDARPSYGKPCRRPLRFGDRESLERALEPDEYSPELCNPTWQGGDAPPRGARSRSDGEVPDRQDADDVLQIITAL